MSKPRDFSRIFLWALSLGDLAVLGGAYALAWALRFRSPWLGAWAPGDDSPRAYWYAAPFALACFWLVFKIQGLYRLRRGIGGVDEFAKLLNALLFGLLLVSALAFFIREFHFSIKVFLLMAALSLLGLPLWRTAARFAQIRLRQAGLGVARALVVGSGPMARKLVERVRAHPGAGYRIVGLVDDGPAARRAAKAWGLPYLGPIDRLDAAVAVGGADCIVVALPASMHAKTRDILMRHSGGTELRIVSDLYGFITSPVAVDDIHGIPVFALREAPLDRPGNRALKRALDLALALPALLLLAPLLLLLALLVKLDSPGPAFFSQERVGHDNRRFRMLKFRTMRADAEKGSTWTVRDDPRRTRLGGFLRRSSIDELPQLINVIRGEMSLVGPRPEQPRYVEQFGRRIPRYLQRHQVKAGLTGWAQVNGWRGDTSIEERTAFDLYYVENWNLSLDLLILLKTALELFEHKDAY